MYEGKVDDTTVNDSIDESGITVSPHILESDDSETVVKKSEMPRLASILKMDTSANTLTDDELLTCDIKQLSPEEKVQRGVLKGNLRQKSWMSNKLADDNNNRYKFHADVSMKGTKYKEPRLY